MSKRTPPVRGIDVSSACRISFLEQCALLLGSMGEKRNDFYSNLAIGCLTELKEFGYVEQVRPEVTVQRSVCPQCRHILIPKCNGEAIIKVEKRKKRIIRQCLHCGQTKSYLHNVNYKSRGEKAK